jgi:integrase/recombinase XerD
MYKAQYKAQPQFYTQRSESFTANTLTHIINGIYQQADISNASSHTTLADKGVSVRVPNGISRAQPNRYYTAIQSRPSVIRAAVKLV